MIDFGLDKIAIIGAVALVVLGPEKLPRVARTVGHLMGKAQRYVAEVKAEVNRSIELEELQKMKSTVVDAARDVEQSILRETNAASAAFNDIWKDGSEAIDPLPPIYRNPRKKWRLKRGATPQWYKLKAGVRRNVQSGAARVARFRPPVR